MNATRYKRHYRMRCSKCGSGMAEIKEWTGTFIRNECQRCEHIWVSRSDAAMREIARRKEWLRHGRDSLYVGSGIGRPSEFQ